MKPKLFKFTLKSGKELLLSTTTNPIPHFVKAIKNYRSPNDILYVNDDDSSPVFLILISEIASIELMSEP